MGSRSLKEDFADLLDARDRELTGGKLPSGTSAPEPSFLLTLANNLEVFSTATAKRERDPNTGRIKVSFTEEKGTSGAVAPPPSFLVAIPVFQDAQPQPLEVRLRVTVDNGKAKFLVQIHAAADVLRAAFSELCADVSEGTSLPLFFGNPEGMSETLERRARRMFEAFQAEGPTPWREWDGKHVPPWEDLGEAVRGKWRAAAREALLLLGVPDELEPEEET
jgi:hypothetical protein